MFRLRKLIKSKFEMVSSIFQAVSKLFMVESAKNRGN